MAKNLKPGNAVSWKSSSGDAQGNVVKKITTPTQIKGHKIAASRDNPRVHRRTLGADSKILEIGCVTPALNALAGTFGVRPLRVRAMRWESP